ncbi:MAG: lipoyl(octanoyl) transferase LipB [Rickettsiales bacterium]|nr:lipoyl(octanoyl) transferase LipB [Rickettsiales bacterium]
MLEINYKTSPKLVDYQKALQDMDEAVLGCQNQSKNMVWFLEHPSLYTKGVSARQEELLNENILPIYDVDRGGKFIYHGPGQRVVYLILDLKKMFAPDIPDVRKYVFLLEEIIIEILKEINIVGLRLPGAPGIWIKTEHGFIPQKIAFIGIKIKKWVSYHGIAFNLDPDLKYFEGIIPCGLAKYEITSLKKLKKEMTKEKFDGLFKKYLEKFLNNS